MTAHLINQTTAVKPYFASFFFTNNTKTTLSGKSSKKAEKNKDFKE